jgi:hypothetical protein
MAKLNMEKMDSLCYDGTTPPDEFIRMFNLQAIFNDWSDEDKLKYFPFFLKDSATTVFDDLSSKTSIAEAIKGIKDGCGPNSDTYMSMFQARSRKPGESFLTFGTALKELLVKGLPDLTGKGLEQMLKMQLTNKVPAEIGVHVKFNKKMEWRELLDSLDSAFPVNEARLDKNMFEESHGAVSINYTNMGGRTNSNANYRNNNNNMGNRPVMVNQSQFYGECYRCHQFGHRQADCPLKNQQNNNYQRMGGYNNRGSMNGSFNRPQAEVRNNPADSGDWRAQNRSNQANMQNNYQGNKGFRSGGAMVNSTVTDFANSSHNEDDFDAQSSFSGISSIGSNSTKVIESNKRLTTASEFPFYSDGNMTIHHNGVETIVMSKNASSGETSNDLLVATVFANVFDDKPREMKSLLDGGSTHSFISPLAIADKHLKQIKNKDKSFEYKEFKIVGATGSVTSRCCVVDCDIEISNWKGKQSFVISDKVARYDMVLGRDFLKRQKVKIDHGEDCFKLGGEWISVNTTETVDVVNVGSISGDIYAANI